MIRSGRCYAWKRQPRQSSLKLPGFSTGFFTTRCPVSRASKKKPKAIERLPKKKKLKRKKKTRWPKVQWKNYANEIGDEVLLVTRCRSQRTLMKSMAMATAHWASLGPPPTVPPRSDGNSRPATGLSPSASARFRQPNTAKPGKTQ